jgi:hypothetical protein
MEIVIITEVQIIAFFFEVLRYWISAAMFLCSWLAIITRRDECLADMQSQERSVIELSYYKLQWTALFCATMIP